MVNPERVQKLVSALETGDVKMVRLMLKGGVPANHFVANGMGSDGATLANLAAINGQAEIFDLLIAEGADITAREVCSWSTGRSMLECACSARNVSMAIVHKILDAGQCQADDMNRSLLCAAYAHGDLVKVLLKAGANPNYVDTNLDTSLIIALTCGQESIAIELLDAGADATVRVKNKARGEFWKKLLDEVAKKQGMQRFLERLSVSQPLASVAAKQLKVSKPKTVEECWTVIGRWLGENLPKVNLPGPCTLAEGPETSETLHLPVAEQLRQSMAIHDGSGELALIPMRSDANYCLLSYADSVAAKKSMQAVFESERELATRSQWWSPTWWPIADNGGGDYLVLECSEGKNHGQIRKFSHETRRPTNCASSFLALLQGVAIDLLSGAISPDEMAAD